MLYVGLVILVGKSFFGTQRYPELIMPINKVIEIGSNEEVLLLRIK